VWSEKAVQHQIGWHAQAPRRLSHCDLHVTTPHMPQLPKLRLCRIQLPLNMLEVKSAEVYMVYCNICEICINIYVILYIYVIGCGNTRGRCGCGYCLCSWGTRFFTRYGGCSQHRFILRKVSLIFIQSRQSSERSNVNIVFRCLTAPAATANPARSIRTIFTSPSLPSTKLPQLGTLPSRRLSQLGGPTASSGTHAMAASSSAHATAAPFLAPTAVHATTAPPAGPAQFADTEKQQQETKESEGSK